ncbi:MAG: hypothetical protein FWC03_07900 [Treponema sp.]|nr:hypothetical protein [Treponema sp.]
MKKLCLIIIISFLLTGCVTPVKVKYGVNVSDGIYALPIAIEFAQDPVKLKYAVNSWVMEQGYTSYDLEVRRFEKMATCYVTIPGSIPVEDLPPVKHYSMRRTSGLVLPLMFSVLYALNVLFFAFIEF